jgi:Na+/proline symporter
LPLVQLALALACHIYDPHQYRVSAQHDGAVNNPEYMFQHNPTPVGTISRGVNFPALVLAYPLRDEGQALYSRNSEYTLVWIGTNDAAFFLGIMIFWYWFARELGRNGERNPKQKWNRYAKLAGLTCGAIFGVLTGAYSIHLISSQWRPERQIGAFGMAWTVGLIAYFSWRVTREFNTDQTQGPPLPPDAVTGC